MAYKVNYGLERAERNRAKEAKKAAKAAAKKVARDTDPASVADAAEPAPELREEGDQPS